MPDSELYAAELRVEMHASSREDAKATLDEVCERLFGEECVVTIVVPDSAAIHPINQTGVRP